MTNMQDHLNNDTVLSIEHVSKTYILGMVTGRTLKDALRERVGRRGGEAYNRTFTALDDISLRVGRGEVVGLIGSNGAGKSTLLKLISRITAPTTGRIRIKGRVASMLEVGTGFHPELTGLENIYLNGSILGMTRAEIDSKLDEIIEFSECREFLNTPVKRYSSGMYVKLAFSVAAHLDSEIMIMDEVLAVGDIQFQNKCLNKMKEIAANEGRTVLYVSHNMETIRKLCTRCVVLEHGHIRYDGDIDEAIQLYRGDHLRGETSMDLTSYLRPGWLGRDDVRLTYAEYPHRTSNRIADTALAITMRWHLNQRVTRMGIRVELMNNGEVPFASAMFYDLYNGEAGDDGETTLTIDLSNVMNGTYQTYYTVFCLDAYQNNIDLDCVRGLTLTVHREESDRPMKWISESWGNIRIQ